MENIVLLIFIMSKHFLFIRGKNYISFLFLFMMVMMVLLYCMLVAPLAFHCNLFNSM